MNLDEIGAILDIPIVLSPTDQDAAAEELTPGLSLVSVSVPLQVALRSNPDVNVILDSESIDQVVIDAPLHEQILFVTDYSEGLPGRSRRAGARGACSLPDSGAHCCIGGRVNGLAVLRWWAPHASVTP